MKKILLSVFFILIFSQSAYALSINAQAGGYFPIKDYGEYFDVGYYYGLSAEQKILPFTSLKLNYSRYVSEGKSNTRYSSGELKGDTIELMVKVAPIDFIISPYISAGGGYYNNKIEINRDKSTYDGFGFVGEAGFNVNFFIMSAGIHVKYNYAKFNSGIKTMENVTAGATFSIHIPFTD